MRLIPGLTWSWKRAIGLSAAKGRLSRRIGVPLSRSGRERKVGRSLLRLFSRGLFAAMALCLAQAASAQPARVFVFVTPDPSGFVDAATKGRTDSMRDLLEKMRGKKDMIVTDDATSADVTLEVLGRDNVESGTATSYRQLYGGVKTFANTRAALHVKLTVGAYSTELVGYSGGEIPLWREAADNVVHKLQQWIKDNRLQLAER